MLSGYPDPRLQHVTITEVHCTPDLKIAQLYVSRMGLPLDEAITVLNTLGPKWRGPLARKLKLRYAPSLTFLADELPDKANHMDALIRGAVAQDKKNHSGE